MIRQESINRMGIMRGTSTFSNGNGRIDCGQQDRRHGGGRHRR